jgi:hypothetical protein
VKNIDVQKIADRIAEECFEAHRGAFWWQEDRRIAVAFGNDGYAGEGSRAQVEVEALRGFLAHYGGREVGFATAADGYSWALACELPEEGVPEAMEAVLWAVWGEASAQRTAGQVPHLNHGAIAARLEGMQAAFMTGAVGGYQGNVARATLERNGLLN